tara:strand:- start:1563 stop:2006 length:444 start_codon:yes stop_codon:yes gene_type:complete
LLGELLSASVPPLPFEDDENFTPPPAPPFCCCFPFRGEEEEEEEENDDEAFLLAFAFGTTLEARFFLPRQFCRREILLLALLSPRYKEEKERGEDSDDDAFDATSQGGANAIFSLSLFLSFFLRVNCLLGIENNNKDGAFSRREKKN